MAIEDDTFFKCSKGTDHLPECDGECGIHELTDAEKELLYERQRWAMSNLPFQGVPHVLSEHFPGIGVDVLETLLRIQALVKLLVEKGIVTQDEFDEALTVHATERMKTLRETFRKQQALSRLAVAQKQVNILGPNGEVLH